MATMATLDATSPTDPLDRARVLVADATWQFDSAPTDSDDRAVGCALVTASGEELAACLWSDGELDTRSDGCGLGAPIRDHLRREDIEWPSEAEALAAVWGRRAARRPPLVTTSGPRASSGPRR